MRLKRAIAMAAVVVVAGGAASVSSAEESKRIVLKLTFADGSEVRLTQIEGKTAEVKHEGSKGLNLGLIPTYSHPLVTVQVLDMNANRKPLAKMTGPLGEPMEFRLTGERADPPTLRITPEKVQ